MCKPAKVIKIALKPAKIAYEKVEKPIQDLVKKKVLNPLIDLVKKPLMSIVPQPPKAPKVARVEPQPAYKPEPVTPAARSRAEWEMVDPKSQAALFSGANKPKGRKSLVIKRTGRASKGAGVQVPR